LGSTKQRVYDDPTGVTSYEAQGIGRSSDQTSMQRSPAVIAIAADRGGWTLAESGLPLDRARVWALCIAALVVRAHGNILVNPVGATREPRRGALIPEPLHRAAVTVIVFSRRYLGGGGYRTADQQLDAASGCQAIVTGRPDIAKI